MVFLLSFDFAAQITKFPKAVSNAERTRGCGLVVMAQVSGFCATRV